MEAETLVQVGLSALAVVLGSGTVQLFIKFISRRSDLRKINSEADSLVVTSANNQVVRLEAELERQNAELLTVRQELDRERTSRSSQLAAMQDKHTQSLAESQQRATEMVEEFRRENAKLNRTVARLQLELSRANAKISALTERSRPGREGDPEVP